MRVYAILALTLLLSACPTTKPPKPHVVPDGNEQWQNLGVSPNGNILNELDKLSIKRSGSIVTFRDKKTVFDYKKEAQLSSTPPHRYSLNTWQIDCSRNTFQLKAMELYDANDRLVASYKYTDQQVKPMPITPDSASFQQKQVVCR